MRDAGLVVDRNARSAARRRGISAFLILLGCMLAVVGHAGDELALTTMGVTVAGTGAILAAVPGAIRVMASIANSMPGRIAIAACIAAVVVLAFFSAAHPGLLR